MADFFAIFQRVGELNIGSETELQDVVAQASTLVRESLSTLPCSAISSAHNILEEYNMYVNVYPFCRNER